MLIDIVAEIDRAIAGHPTRNVDSCDGYSVRQVDDLEVALRNPCVNCGAIPSRHIFQKIQAARSRTLSTRVQPCESKR